MRRSARFGRRPLALLAIVLLTFMFPQFINGTPVSAHSPKNIPINQTENDYQSQLQHAVQGIQALTPAPSEAVGVAASAPRAMRLLVVTATAQEPSYAAVTTFLNQIGIPYTPLIASQQPLTRDLLWQPNDAQGNFQGVILTTGNLGYESSPGVWQSGFDDSEWRLLWEYEARYGIRQVTLYTYPASLPDNYGLVPISAVDTGATPLQATLTTEGAAIFSYLAANAPIEVQYAWTYLTRPEPGVTPLLQTPDGYTLMALKTYPDGRQNLALTMDHSPSLLHSILLQYGVFNWVTGGIFIGERHVYLNIQVDDLLISDDIWDPAARSDTTGLSYRMTGDDLYAIAAWKSDLAEQSNLFEGWNFDWAFNGSGAAKGDDLSQAVAKSRREFGWINHTWDHLNLDSVDLDTALDQFKENERYAKKINFHGYTTKVLVTPDVSGLANPNAMQAAYHAGTRYLVCDSSYPTCMPTTPNTGIWNGVQPDLFMIPRRPTNIFYNVSTPDELTSEYNVLYRSYWRRDLSYEEILNVESENYLRYMLQYSMYPLMFHQTNARLYDGTHSLLSDVLSRAAARYASLMNLPVIHQTMLQTGQSLSSHMEWLASGPSGIYYPNSKIILSAATDTTLPITGLSTEKEEVYGGQSISHIKVKGDKSVTIPLAR